MAPYHCGARAPPNAPSPPTKIRNPRIVTALSTLRIDDYLDTLNGKRRPTLHVRIVKRALELRSDGENDVIDITEKIQRLIEEEKLRDGLATIFVIGSTAAITTIEYEPGLRKDLPATLERIAPKGFSYEHEKTWHDDNAHSHVRASLVGPSLTVPIVEGKLTLGTWQQIIFIEMDTHPRTRKVAVQMIGE